MKTFTHYLHSLLLLVYLLCLPSVMAERQLAFPGADGYGRYVTGGRGGEVCYVTRTDDCSDSNLVPGTLRWAIRHDNGGRPRTILFNVSGTIYLTSKLKFQYPNVSILGQTAPGGGVCVTGYNMYICKNNVIVRYLRFRAGDIPSTSMTGLDIENARGVILDHCSMTWSMEECLTAYDTDSTTIQWCIIGEGLYNSKNSKGARAYATQWGGEHSTMHHTLITNSHSRAPRFNGVRNASSYKGEHDYQVDSEFANNVVFNWSGSGNQYGGEYDKGKVEVSAWTKSDPGYNRVYIINNYYRPGPATQRNCQNSRYWCAPSSPYGQWYLSGNRFEIGGTYCPKTSVWSQTELDKLHADNYYGAQSGSSSRGINLTGSNFSTYSLSELPYALSGLQYESAEQAYQQVVNRAGASLPRYDEVDQRLIDEAAGRVNPRFAGSSIPGEPGIIDSPDDIQLSEHDTYMANGVTYTNFPFLGLRSGDKYMIDSDADGLPDPYEELMGLDKLNADDGAQRAENGYTHLENYLNAIADGTIQKSQFETSDFAVTPGQSNHPDQVTYRFLAPDTQEGDCPDGGTVAWGSQITIPRNATLYKQGHTLTCWSYEGHNFYPGDVVAITTDVSFRAVFVPNSVAFDDRIADLKLTWDFTDSLAPTLVADSYDEGIYVAQNRVEGQIIDVRLSYLSDHVTLPWCEGATVAIDGTPVQAQPSSDLTTASLTAHTPFGQLQLTLPYQAPVISGSGPVTLSWPWTEGIFEADAQINEDAQGTMLAQASYNPDVLSCMGKSSWNINFTSFQPIADISTPDADNAINFVITPASGATFRPMALSFSTARFGTDRGYWDISIIRDGQEQFLQQGIKPNRNNATEPTNVSCTIDGLAASASPLTVRLYLYDLGITKQVGLRMINIEGEWEGTVTPAGPGDEPEPPVIPDINYDCTPFDVAVHDAAQLTQALASAASRADKEARYRIFLHDGIYDFGKVAKTAVPALTSLIGESQEGVIILNNPGPVSSNYQELTPVLFIDQNQNDVYMQDLTIRQDRDWAAKRSQGQALALRQRGKRAVYKNVTMQGVQDTYYLNKADATAYFETSSLSGEVDFIYGDGTMWFSQCLVNPLSSSACITASNAQAGYKGIIFDHCTIDGASGYRLGRPWSDSPAVTYLHTTMRSLPNAAGWGSMTSGLKVRFHEYGSMDAQGQLLDLSSRSIAACNAASGSDLPVLTAEQAEAYTLASTFHDWDPQERTRQLSAPQLNVENGQYIAAWQPVEDAIGYAICVDGKVAAFTTSTNGYDLPEAGTITIRAISPMGGLGTPSAAIHSTDGIITIQSDAAETQTLYNLMGQPLRAMPRSGLYLHNGRKVMIKQ